MEQKAIFAAGCFWGVESAFMEVEGVNSTKVGYTGGDVPNPTYEEVCTGTTNHAEAVEVKFDSTKVPYEDLLDVFWSIHDPTTVNRQGLDTGTQYRSAIFYTDTAQKESAIKSKDKHQQFYKEQIATQILPEQIFFKAEDYHQQYFKKTGKDSCHL